MRYKKTILRAIRSAISSQASGDGVSRSDWLDGPSPSRSGPAVAHVSRTPRRAKGKAKKIHVISGLFGSASSKSADLQLLLANKWKERLNLDGSMECTLTWKTRGTPSGLLLYQVVSSMRPISEIESTSSPKSLWLTVRTKMANEDPLKSSARLGDRWSTTAGCLESQVLLALWTTLSNRDHKDSFGMTAERKDGKSRHDQLPRQAFGTLTSSSYAEMKSIGESPRLNLEFARWIMGFPKEWCLAAPAKRFARSKRAQVSSKDSATL